MSLDSVKSSIISTIWSQTGLTSSWDQIFIHFIDEKYIISEDKFPNLKKLNIKKKKLYS